MEAAAVTAPDGRVYVLGGSAYDESSRSWAALRAVEVYTPATNRWASAPPMPVRRTAFAAVLGSDGRIYVIGGTSTPYYTASPARALRTVDSYCPRTRTWSRTSRLPVASLGLAAAMGPDGRIYAIGGSAGNAVYTYRVPPGPC